jgi:hypothetical protein
MSPGRDRREVKPPIWVEAASWSPVGELDYWVRDRYEWCRVRGPDGHHLWIRAAQLRQAPDELRAQHHRTTGLAVPVGAAFFGFPVRLAWMVVAGWRAHR